MLAAAQALPVLRNQKRRIQVLGSPFLSLMFFSLILERQHLIPFEPPWLASRIFAVRVAFASVAVGLSHTSETQARNLVKTRSNSDQYAATNITYE